MASNYHCTSKLSHHHKLLSIIIVTVFTVHENEPSFFFALTTHLPDPWLLQRDVKRWHTHLDNDYGQNPFWMLPLAMILCNKACIFIGNSNIMSYFIQLKKLCIENQWNLDFSVPTMKTMLQQIPKLIIFFYLGLR